MSRPELYGFPLLTDDDIIQCMDELRVPVTREDLAKVPQRRGRAGRGEGGARH